jgi:hypothetical protein
MRYAALGVIALFWALDAPIAAADDTKPRALPDRIDDVPATKPDPFPAFDNFSWRAFIALNWPSLTDPAHRGEPDRSKTLSDAGPRVWETFKSRYEVFQRDAAGHALAPAGWPSYDGVNPCGVDNRTKTLNAFTTFSDFNQASLAFGKSGNPLVAQNHTYTRFEVRINHQHFDSIVAHKWYIRGNLPTRDHFGTFGPASIQVKAAWRILTDQDTAEVRRRYYVVNDAMVLDVAKSLAAKMGVCAKHDIALVGFHIVTKTTYRPQWIWSSFEHIDNVPPAGTGEAREPDAKDAHVPYSYNNANQQQVKLEPAFDSPQVAPIGADNPPKLDPEPMQVIREHPINAKTMAMNRAYWALPEIRNSVWANYMLVATQWPTVTQPNTPANDGQPFPGGSVDRNSPVEVYQLGGDDLPVGNLANTTMETYQQAPTSSCMACHHLISNAQGHDFVAFIQGDANDAVQP